MKLTYYLLFLCLAAMSVPLTLAGRTYFVYLVWLVILLTIVYFRIQHIVFRVHLGIIAAILLLTVAGLFGGIVYGRPDLYYLFKMIQNLVFFMIILQWARDMHIVKRMLEAFAAGGTIGVVSGFFYDQSEHIDQMSGILLNPNEYGQLCGQVVIVCVGLFSLARSLTRKCALLAIIAVSLLGLMHSASRGAFFALLGGGAILLLLQVQRKKMILVSILGVLLFYFFVPQIFLDRLDTAFRARKLRRQAAITVRMQLVGHGWKIFVKHPVFGVGMGNVRTEMERRFGLSKSTHNVFTQLLSETGAVGFLAFLYILLKCAKTLWRGYARSDLPKSSKVILATLVGYLGTLILGQSSSGNYVHTQFFFAFGIITALPFILKRPLANHFDNRGRGAETITPAPPPAPEPVGAP